MVGLIFGQTVHLGFDVFRQRAAAVYAELLLESGGDWGSWLLVDLGSSGSMVVCTRELGC